MKKKYVIILLIMISSIVLIINYLFIINNREHLLVDNPGEVTESSSAISKELEYMNQVDYLLMKSNDETLYFNAFVQDSQTGNMAEKVYYLDTSDATDKIEMLVLDLDKEGIINFVASDDERLYLLIEEYHSQGKTYYLKRANKNGEIATIVKLDDIMMNDENLYNWNLELTSEGNIIVYSDILYSIYSETGEKLESKLLDYSDSGWYQIHCLAKGIAMVETIKEGRTRLLLYENGIISDINIPNELIDSVTFEIISDNEESCLIKNDTKLYRFYFKTGTIEDVITWSDYGVVGREMSLTYINKNKEIGGFIVETFNKKITKISMGDKQQDPQEQQLTVGCIGDDDNIVRAVAKYNSEDNGYFVKIKNYMGEIDNQNEALNKMYQEILSGNGPDILAISNDNIDYIDYMQLGNKNILEDLQAYFSKGQGIDESMFVQSVLDSCKSDDNLYMIPTNFGIETIISKNELFGDKFEWEINDFSKLIAENPNIDKIFTTVDRFRFLDSCYQYGMHKDKKQFTFDADKFKKYLEFSKQFPESVVYDADFSVYRKGKVLGDVTVISDMETYLFDKAVWEQEIVFKGYPGVEGNGSVLVPINGWAISSKSSKKEEAWQFISKLFSNEWQEDVVPNWNFSSLKEKFEQQLIELVDTSDSNTPLRTYELDGMTISVMPPTDDDVKQIKNLVEGVEKIRFNDVQITNILDEEVGAYFNGQKSADEVTEIIEKRISTYIKEQ